MSKKKKRKQLESQSAQLNIMPFIDIFSMLNTFLLISASFVSIGILKVQVPFFTNSPPDKSIPARSLTLNVNVEKEKLSLTTRWSTAPVDENKRDYSHSEKGLAKLHGDLIKLRVQYPAFDKVSLFSEDNVKYKQLVKVIDSIKILEKDDPVIQIKDEKTGDTIRSKFLYEKVVIASVVL